MVAEDEMVGWCHQLNGQSLSKLWEMVKERTEEPGVLQSVGVTKGWTQLNNNSLSAVFGLDSWASPRSSSLPPLLLKPMENGHRNT